MGPKGPMGSMEVYGWVYIYIYMLFFLLFVLIKPVPDILHASTLIRYRFVGGAFFEHVFSPKGAPKNSQEWGVWGVRWGGGQGV